MDQLPNEAEATKRNGDAMAEHSYDTEGKKLAEDLAKIGVEIHTFYDIALTLLLPEPPAMNYDDTVSASGTAADPVGEAATDPRRQTRHRHLKQTRQALGSALYHARIALHHAAKAAKE